MSKQGKIFSHKQIVEAHQELLRCTYNEAQAMIDKIYHYSAICEAIRKKQEYEEKYQYNLDKDYDKWVEDQQDDENENN